jgi:flagellar transcriptional activator FlhC
MKNKRVIDESYDLSLAIRLIKLGARIQLLEAETSLSRERLTRLYKELIGVSPPKGMLPFSADWFLPWAANIHSSLFLNIRAFLLTNSKLNGIQLLATAYELYLEAAPALSNITEQKLDGLPYLSLMRAWTLTRFLENKMLTMNDCQLCNGSFVANTYDLNLRYVCNLCRVPSRAGKSKRYV